MDPRCGQGLSYCGSPGESSDLLSSKSWQPGRLLVCHNTGGSTGTETLGLVGLSGPPQYPFLLWAPPSGHGSFIPCGLGWLPFPLSFLTSLLGRGTGQQFCRIPPMVGSPRGFSGLDGLLPFQEETCRGAKAKEPHPSI